MLWAWHCPERVVPFVVATLGSSSFVGPALDRLMPSQPALPLRLLLLIVVGAVLGRAAPALLPVSLLPVFLLLALAVPALLALVALFCALEHWRRQGNARLPDSVAALLCSRVYGPGPQIETELWASPWRGFALTGAERVMEEGLEARVALYDLCGVEGSAGWLAAQVLALLGAPLRHVVVVIKGTDVRSYSPLFADVNLALSEAKVLRGCQSVLGRPSVAFLGSLRLSVLRALEAQRHPGSLKVAGACRVWVTGHSLGGYLAQRLSWELVAPGGCGGRSGVPLECVAFESPGLLADDLACVRRAFGKTSTALEKLKPRFRVYQVLPNSINMLGSHELSSVWACRLSMDTWEAAYLRSAALAAVNRTLLYVSLYSAIGHLVGAVRAALDAARVAAAARQATSAAAAAQAAAAAAAQAATAAAQQAAARPVPRFASWVASWVPSLMPPGPVKQGAERMAGWVAEWAAPAAAEAAAQQAAAAGVAAASASAATSALGSVCEGVVRAHVLDQQKHLAASLLAAGACAYNVLGVEASHALALHSIDGLIAASVEGPRIRAARMRSWPTLGAPLSFWGVTKRALHKVFVGDMGWRNLVEDRNRLLTERLLAMPGYEPELRDE
ncbi:hypothetical protein HYH03_006310 [Edaphochlamys debaryana]|uniref:Uncharacterized protein n=1 Tax=Edaphochlamys debaryana TaxID=47281 RepID=A0A835YB86_9CHLO|nr:hypothetical protein HYH03_006310 [Edaphochlamys debaryana]|eukprot:KAG2495710.1 hypothetical protein HYH03_006310 [Edaphochlamys debaryana]